MPGSVAGARKKRREEDGTARKAGRCAMEGKAPDGRFCWVSVSPKRKIEWDDPDKQARGREFRTNYIDLGQI